MEKLPSSSKWKIRALPTCLSSRTSWLKKKATWKLSSESHLKSLWLWWIWELASKFFHFCKYVGCLSSRWHLAMALNAWTVLTPQSITNTWDYTQSRETERRHAQEVEAKELLIIQNLEVQMGILNWWGPNNNKWKQAAAMVGKRRYQRCLDLLEGLVVARMFELTKMNVSNWCMAT